MNKIIIRDIIKIMLILLTFISVFAVIHLIHRIIFPSEIIFYSSILDIFIALFITIASLYIIGKYFSNITFFDLDHKNYICLIIAYIFIAYSYVITIPTLLDRSISIFMISAVAENGTNGIDKNSLQELFMQKYVKGSETIQKRINEQVSSNHFEEYSERIFITKKGLFIYSMIKFLVDLLNIDDKYVRITKDANRNY